MYYSDIEQHVESLERELDETLRELTETHRVSRDLENQIHEDGGFIDQIVELEEENARLREENATYAGLLGSAIELVMSEKPCNCGFGGFHDDGNPRCDRNGD